MCEALAVLLDNIYIRLGFKLYRKIVCIPMGTNCAPLVADLFLFCYDWDLLLALSEDNQSDVTEAFSSTSRYLDDLMDIDNNFFDSMVNHIYPSELQFNKANVCDIEASFFGFTFIYIGFVKTKIYDKREDFDFDIVNFSFLDDAVPRSTSYGVYISQLIRFARVSSHVDDFNTRNKVLKAELLKQVYRYHKLHNAFSVLSTAFWPGRVAQSVGHLTRKSGVLGSIPGLATYFRFSFRFFKKGSCQLLAKVCARSTG